MAPMYRDAVAKHQRSVQKYLSEMEEVLSSDEEEPLQMIVVENVVRSYERGGGDAALLPRTKHLLEESVSCHVTICLICIGSVKKADPIWNCSHCYACFHFACIQKWANDSISLRTEDDQGPISVHVQKKVEWCCPKCRHSYTKEYVPRKYKCYCEKLDDPPLHGWLLPHSCGELCQKRLSLAGNCNHKCVLLCHPGPCPPCPQTVLKSCHCEREEKNVRCYIPKWSCGQRCNKILSCKSHRCENICHEHDCPPCTYTSIQSCCCGAEEMKRPCNDPMWHCQKPCKKPYGCGYHECDKVCHGDDCGLCPNSGMRSCPCGANQRYVECPDVMETCVGTCGKQHAGCDHNCPEKCHKGACPPCQVVMEKPCLCGAHSRQLPCSREFKCETKCRGVRPCRKHGCGRRCCNGECPPCEKICDKPLQCGRHKCTMICHSGPCYPCPKESKVTCRCKETYYIVPCGRERYTKPPKCFIPCKIKYKCGHDSDNTHSCHFGACLPCTAICEKRYDKCWHSCPDRCHVAVPVVFKQTKKPATPWEFEPPKTKIMSLECQPCETPVLVQCFGKHEIDDQPCHSAKRGPCGRLCGRKLACGNHECAMLCHLLSPDKDYPNVPSACEPCNLDCLVPRPEKCLHKCALVSCHPGQCPPCDILERCLCHCGITEIYIRCRELQSASEEALSCKQQCSKNLKCGHRCRAICHSGACGINQICVKKTKTYCACGNIKKELPCNLVQSGEAAVKCDETCEAKQKTAQLEKEREDKRRLELEEEKNRRELEEYEWKLGKKKKYKEKKVVISNNDINFLQKWWMAIVSFVVVLAASMYYIFYAL